MSRLPMPEDPAVRALIARSTALRSRELSRRSFLVGALGATGAAAFLAACGTGGGPGAATSGSGGGGGPLRWANWSYYLDQSDDGQSYPTLDAFNADSDFSVEYFEDIEDNDSFYGKVRGQLEAGQDIGYDLVVLTDWMSARWVRMGYCATLDRDAMPNTANLLDNLQSTPFDPDRTLTITWQSGLTGIAWDKAQLPGGVQSMEQLWDPALKGRVEVLSEMLDTIPLIMLEQGVDPSGDWGDTEFTAALDVLVEQIGSGQIRQVRGNSYTQDLVSGDAIACVAWSGDIAALNFENDDRFGFAIPDAGGNLWSDNFIVPTTTSRVADAQTLIDYYYDPAVAAEVAAWVNYITPVKGAREAMADIDPDLVDNELIFPTEETLSRVHQVRMLTPEEEEDFNGRFLDVIGA